ncbi:helicase primase subunit [Psittacid alphaherpesvirus 1]|uniref:DNA helicase/primase complex-associated protein n=1 Tax=Psittacid herpesvirus 1 (isolate Amazon parrot/-/97-0001/1997) TaxID=670426 RepID=HEPA_PSHV1|nr:helicase-primase subunit [Psittacid alphaherpesvirus 1]Q6UDH2.1 RecName: Full=DNA helicase/primase complex-associated protein; Short=HEPA; AltName: Full=Primase-associated factor [Psittacid herpesvirus 1 Amazon parrot/1997]AAQ73738.1 helicase primase subunit [Psittacid alphaherpesvirus 1]
MRMRSLSAASSGYNGDPRGLGLERLKTVVRGKLRPSGSEIEWLWPSDQNNTASPAGAKTDQPTSAPRFFLTREATVFGPSWKPASRQIVASVLPVTGEMVMVSAERFSCMALFAVFLKLYRGFYMKPVAPCATHVRRPIMLAQFPVFDSRPSHGPQEQSGSHEPLARAAAQRRTKHNFLFMPGFPCLACVPISASAERHDRAMAACRAASLTEHLWPAYGIRALHMLNRTPAAASITRAVARRSRLLTADLTRSLETFPAGTITCAAGAPMIFSDCRLARLDFSAFYPCLYAAYVGKHRGLTKILHERLRRRAGSEDLKPALVTMFGGLRHVDANGYRFVVGASNIIAKAVEQTANRMGFGVAAYVKDGFWGAFDSSSKTTAEELRAECEKAANATLARLVVDKDGAGEPPVSLVLRLEGVYTDGLLINANKYWLFNSESGDSFICGVMGGHERSGLSRETTAAADDILKKIKASAKSIDDVEAIARSRIDAWIYAIFGHRGDVEFWAEQTPGDKDFLIPEEIRTTTVGKLEAADSCLGGELSYVFIPKNTQDTGAAKTKGGGARGWHSAPAAAFPCSLVEDVFCIKINYEAHLLPRLEGLLAWSRIYAWLQFRNQIPLADDEDESTTQAKETARIDYNYGDVSFLFA